MGEVAQSATDLIGAIASAFIRYTEYRVRFFGSYGSKAHNDFRFR